MRFSLHYTLWPLLWALLAGGCTLPLEWPYTPEETKARVAKSADRPLPLESMPKIATPPPLLKPDARGVVKLSLEQVAIYALAGNQDLAVARYGPVLAGTFRLVESGVFDPQVYAGLTYNRENAQEYSSTRRTTYKEEETEIEAGTGVRQKLPTGTTIDLSLSHTATDSNQEPDQHNPRLGLTVTQALLQGYGPAVNLVKVRQTMLGERASLYQLRGFSETLLADAETVYWQFVLAG
ncbi:MAG: hypothetical protein PVG03_12065, partial [Desulfarculaceae bacterium]